MVTKLYGDVVFECDSCDETFETAQADWNSAWNMAKRDGWKARKIGNEWSHTCPACNITDEE